MKDLLFTGEDQPAYFVHYKGWKQTWDEWVPESRMHKNTPENRQKQKSLKESIMKKKQPPSSTQSAGAGAQRNKPKSGGQPENSRKRGRETEEFTQESFKRPEIRLIIPDELKVLLVDDWEFVTKNNQLVPLPRTPSVKQLLLSYREHVESKITNDTQKAKKKALVEEVTNGLEVYFNRAIASNLLYRFERPQFVQIKKEADERPDNHEHKQLSALYGTEHFLRLIANRGQFTAAATSATKSNGVPAAVHGLNFARTYGSADHHHEGRSDAPARFAVASNFSTTKTVFNSPAPSRKFSTSSKALDTTQVPDFSPYRSKNTGSNKAFSYFMVGSMGLLASAGAKATVTDILSNLSASADVLALAKAEVDISAIPEGKNVTIKWRGKPVFIRHRTASEIEEADKVEMSDLRDPQKDADRFEQREWLVMLGVHITISVVELVKVQLQPTLSTTKEWIHLRCALYIERTIKVVWVFLNTDEHATREYTKHNISLESPTNMSSQVPVYSLNEDKLVIG
ncbi:MRG-domain-containing protein [Wallemia mellicola]|nr:hypothetical protein E3Q24_02269 [Wallemia mellicola]TIB90982.1 MRG-domain-containing protein [Wallemia mellicola]TIB92707.1 MRG-domain-containing protein [Wallemia mellicola]TIC44535.1 MRG-domain-containing protein [Wallemia mellicola]TIC53632.1 MRG-domain-containing protein [Wallemia mellicola]